MVKVNKEVKVIFGITLVIFGLFLLIPMCFIIRESFSGDAGTGLMYYRNIFGEIGIGKILWNSVSVSLLSAVITTVLAFCMAYTLNFTKLHGAYKKFVYVIACLPMFLPTVTYGFAIIYALGKQGLITKIFGGKQLFDIYGFPGMMIGFIIYTLPVAFVLINNTMKYIDKKYLVISRTLGDSNARSFYTAILRPLSGTLTASAIQCFFLSFTDYGIPIAVGGKTEVIATALYKQMLGSIPDFNNGSAIAIMMLLPSIISIALLTWVDRYNVRYKSVSQIELRDSRARDTAWGIVSALISLFVIGIFATVIVLPFVDSWPYSLTFTFQHFIDVFSDSELTGVYVNSIFVAFMVAAIGTLFVYAAGLVSIRSDMSKGARKVIDALPLITNTIPGMVLGVAYMLLFSGTSLQNTFALIIICTIIHYFTTPYLMMKGSLEKMDSTWETTAKLMGDSWTKTVVHIITPNAVTTLAEMFSYYFVNAMVTISAVVFLVGARTMLLTIKIQELEHFQRYDDIFVLSILILVTNLIVKGAVELIIRKSSEKEKVRWKHIAKAEAC
jgi:iron(III) transport system permease protein